MPEKERQPGYYWAQGRYDTSAGIIEWDGIFFYIFCSDEAKSESDFEWISDTPIPEPTEKNL